MNKDLLGGAARFSREFHYHQLRDDGSPYFYHPIRVMANVLTAYGSEDEGMLCAALLHDVVEDCGVKFEDLQRMFNDDIANIVKELTNVYTKQRYPHLNSKQRHKLEHERISGISLRGKRVKLADRFDNISSAYNHPKKDFLEYYREDTKKLLDAIDLPGDPLFLLTQKCIKERVY